MARKETKLSRGGEEWTVEVMSQDEAREEDLDFWLQVSPEERVRAVEELTLGRRNRVTPHEADG